jgi:multiple sugar transport system permease protein
VIYAALSLVSLIVAFPVLWMLSISFRPNVETFSLPPRLIPQTFILDAYKSILSNPDYLRFFVNSYFVGLMVTLVSVCIGSLAGYGFSRFDFRGNRVMEVFIVVTQMIPPITLLIPYFAMIVAFRLYDNYLGLIVTYTSFTLPYSILMLTGYFNTISKELDEAAIVDGCSHFRVLWNVVLPVAIPGIISTAIYTFLLSWNEFLFALALTRSTSMRTVPVGIALLMGEASFHWNEMMSFSVLGSIPVLILFLFVQKYFLAGLTAGAVKG